MKKKLLAALLAGVMAVGLTACGGNTSTDAPAADGEANGDSAAGSYTVGVCQLVQHAALDAATQGFQDKLTELIEADGGTVTFDVKNASGESANCASIINGFVSSGVDLILANATASLQAAQAGTTDIPILGTAVTDYGTALGIDDWTGTTGTNISGTADLAPLDQQAAMLNELFPDAKTVGLLYCSAEPNSKYQIDTIKPMLEEKGYTCEEFAFADSNDVASVTTSACAASDVIYIPTDNTAASAPRPSATWSCPPRPPWSPVSRASAPAAAWPPCPSTITSWVRSPVRWLTTSWSRALTPPPWRSSMPPTPPRCTTRTSARSWASPRPTGTPPLRPDLDLI